MQRRLRLALTDTYYDLIVLGAGSGGVRAARLAAQLGLKVAIIEKSEVGGTCVNLGCIPKKLLWYGSHYSEDFADSRAYGWLLQSKKFDWACLRDNKNREIARLNQIYENLLIKANVTIIKGKAHLIDEHTILVQKQKISGNKILIATGSKPFIPDIAGAHFALTSDEMFFLDQLPKKAIIVGAGYIGVEFAGILNSLGVHTSILHRGEKILKGFDEDAREHAQKEMQKKGINFFLTEQIATISKLSSDHLKVTCESGNIIDTELILMATGRIPNTSELGLESVGVALDNNQAIVVDDFFKTSVDNIYAIGDVIDKLQLTPVAIAQAHCVIANLFEQNHKKMNYKNIPVAVFGSPVISMVGLTEEEARKTYKKIKIFKTEFKALKYTLAGRDEKTLVKLIVDDLTDRVVGIHMVSLDAAEIMQGLAVAMQAGATKAHFDQTLGIHPTAAEEFVTMRKPQ